MQPLDESAVAEVVEGAKQTIAGIANAKRYLKGAYEFLEQMSRDELIIALANELFDSTTYAHSLSLVYDQITCSRISKPNTHPSTALSVMEEFWSLKEDDDE
jgi:hypothetical protein